jgi:hypothetical protein
MILKAAFPSGGAYELRSVAVLRLRVLPYTRLHVVLLLSDSQATSKEARLNCTTKSKIHSLCHFFRRRFLSKACHSIRDSVSFDYCLSPSDLPVLQVRIESNLLRMPGRKCWYYNSLFTTRLSVPSITSWALNHLQANSSGNSALRNLS